MEVIGSIFNVDFFYFLRPEWLVFAPSTNLFELDYDGDGQNRPSGL